MGVQNYVAKILLRLKQLKCWCLLLNSQKIKNQLLSVPLHFCVFIKNIKRFWAQSQGVEISSHQRLVDSFGPLGVRNTCRLRPEFFEATTQGRKSANEVLEGNRAW